MAAVEEGRLVLEGCAPPEPFDECLWCTQASAPAWLARTGLPLGGRPTSMLARLLLARRCLCLIPQLQPQDAVVLPYISAWCQRAKA